MGSLKATADKGIGKVKELVAEIIGDGKLRDEAKLDQQKADEQKNASGGFKPLGNLDRLT